MEIEEDSHVRNENREDKGPFYNHNSISYSVNNSRRLLYVKLLL